MSQIYFLFFDNAIACRLKLKKIIQGVEKQLLQME